jgi:hypothetical protein
LRENQDNVKEIEKRIIFMRGLLELVKSKLSNLNDEQKRKISKIVKKVALLDIKYVVEFNEF